MNINNLVAKCAIGLNLVAGSLPTVGPLLGFSSEITNALITISAALAASLAGVLHMKPSGGAEVKK
jgi:hypothetical protein